MEKITTYSHFALNTVKKGTRNSLELDIFCVDVFLLAKLLTATLSPRSQCHFALKCMCSKERIDMNILCLNVTSTDDEPVMTDEERLAAIVKQYAVLNNRTSGSILQLSSIIEVK